MTPKERAELALRKKKSVSNSTKVEEIKPLSSDKKTPSFQTVRRTVTEKEISEFDFSQKTRDPTQSISKEQLEAARKEFLGDENEEEKTPAGFIDDDTDFDFAKEEEKKPSGGLFSRLTSKIKNFTGGKQMTSEELAPIMQDFKDGLIEKNVAQEIA